MTTPELFSLEGKTALVTGGSRGIGLMIATGFIEAGARVYISSRNAEVCNEVAAALSKNGECISIPADLSTVAGIQKLVEDVSSRESSLHVLVNNAGAAWGAPLEDYPESGFDKVMILNVKSVFYLTTEFLPMLRKAATEDDPARVINIGSIDGLRPPELDNFAYSASKAAVHMLTRHLARDLVEEHITVNAIAPGFFPSKMTAFLFEEGEEPVAAKVPLRRVGRPEDIAGMATLLSSRAGSYLTGAIIPVDGGMSTL